MSSRLPRATFWRTLAAKSMAPLFFDIPQGYKRSCAEKHAFRRFTRSLLVKQSSLVTSKRFPKYSLATVSLDCDRITLNRPGGNRGGHNSMNDGHQYRIPDFLTL